jgi:hypothetical protein
MKKLFFLLFAISQICKAQSITITSQNISSLRVSVVSIVTSYTATSNDNMIVCNNGSSNITITIPNPSTSNKGQDYVIKRDLNSTGIITISSTNIQDNSSNSFVSSTTLLGLSIVIRSDGVRWHRISSN